MLMSRGALVGIFFGLLVLAQPGPPLRNLAEARKIQIGAAVEPSLLLQEPEYARVLAREFNLVVAENVMKWGALQTTRGQYNFAAADLAGGQRAPHLRCRLPAQTGLLCPLAHLATTLGDL